MAFILGRIKSKMIDPERALPGRDEAMPVPGRHDVLGHPIAPPFPDNLEQAVFGMGCFWGRRAPLLGGGRRMDHGCRLRRRLHAEPHERAGVLRQHRAHGGGAGRVRPGEDELRGVATDLLGGPRPDPGHAAGQRRGHAISLRGLLRERRPARGRGGVAGAIPRAPRRRRTRRDHDRACAGGPVLLRRGLPPAVPRARTRTATAASVARASPARWASRQPATSPD